MEKLRIMSVFGTRPEAIKMAPLVKELSGREEIESICCVTAQHREMLDSVLEVFGLTPDWDLDIMTPRQTLSTITSKCLTGMDEAIDALKPDLILVHGDTSTTFAGALSAFYHKVPVGHVEAGLRTYDKYSPYPEEMNRKLVTAIADLYFCPTESNRRNLEREGITENIFVTGNTVIDALKTTVVKDYHFTTEILNDLPYDSKKIVLVTCHRRENYGQPMEDIMSALAHIARTHPDTILVYPVHLSPVVQECAKRHLEGIENVRLTAPLSAGEMHNLMARCCLVLTDSGGLQEEAPALGKPVLVLRRETERPEAVEAGTAKLAGVAYDDIVSMADQLLTDPAAYAAMARAVNPYGDGQACRRIADAILWHFGRGPRPEDFRS
ncbi:MAG: UDP-N-acetylglucosamine 2-epimerase (non-hydrolyzing) [Oscillospiraceae bacterium]|jgi:UDP-N-acetylglucosamine 2-epimerase (non-hydrolysing)|nr:UDP-N-acetylglucosamine 2-epimerase (non-hydrolyzing) [Oscillospiraceae bacterium]